jgi:ATP/maltotriose-dependent transcriptional regulator MalT
MHGEYSRGQALFEEALVLFRATGNELMVAGTLLQSAQWLWASLGDAETIHQRLHEAEALVHKVGSRHWMAEYLLAAAEVAWSEGETEKAYRMAQESQAIFREIDAKWHLAWSILVLGRVEVQRGDLSAARSSHQESLALAQALDEKFIASFDLEGLAGLAAAWQEGRTMTSGQALAAQGRLISPPPAGSLPASPSKTYPASTSGLTAREVEVLRLLAQGMTNPQIAKRLILSSHTVHAHVRSIYTKLEVNSRSGVTHKHLSVRRRPHSYDAVRQPSRLPPAYLCTGAVWKEAVDSACNFPVCNTFVTFC